MEISKANLNGVQPHMPVKNSVVCGQESSPVNPEESKLENSPKEDTLVKTGKSGTFTKAEKKEILYKAQTNAAGWSILGGGISSIYYGVRDEEKIAHKYNLDSEKDEQLINDIRTKQVIATLPGVFGAGILGWICYKIFAKPNK